MKDSEELRKWIFLAVWHRWKTCALTWGGSSSLHPFIYIDLKNSNFVLGTLLLAGHIITCKVDLITVFKEFVWLELLGYTNFASLVFGFSMCLTKILFSLHISEMVLDGDNKYKICLKILKIKRITITSYWLSAMLPRNKCTGMDLWDLVESLLCQET